MSNYVIELDEVIFKRENRIIIDGLSLAIAKNKLTALMGPSGVGKTTIIKLITAQETPYSGIIRVFGENIHKLSRKALYSFRKKIGVLFQYSALLSDLSVFDNIALPIKQNTRLNKRQIADMVAIKLEAVGLLGAMQLYPRELSGGMSRRVSLARSLALDPEIIIYDEPFVGQDPISMGVLIKLIHNISTSMDITTMAISHDVTEILSIADYAYLLSQGKSVADGTPKELNHNQSEYTKQFIKGIEDGPVPFHYPNNIPLKERLLSLP